MSVTFELKSPDNLMATISITMTVKNFRELKTQLQSVYPSWELGNVISDVIYQAEKTFYASEPQP